MTMNDGTPVDGGEIQRIKDQLVKAFGGYTHLKQRSEGAWRMGGVDLSGRGDHRARAR